MNNRPGFVQDEGVTDPHEPSLRPHQRLERHIFRTTVAGVLVLIPLLVTIAIVNFVVVAVDGVIRPLTFVKDKPWDVWGIGLAFFLVAFYLVGLLVSGGAGRRKVVQWQGAVLSRVPIVKSIYGVAKQATDTISSSMDHQFSRVVFIEWPRPGFKALGFVTGHLQSPAEERTVLVVYVPTVPNPTSGNLAFVLEEDIVETEMSVEEAMKVVFSGGIVLPDDMRVTYRAGLPEPPAD